MSRQIRRNSAELCCEPLFQLFTSASMLQCPAHGRYPLVEDFAVNGMDKFVPARGATVREGVRARRPEEWLQAGQSQAALLKILWIDITHTSAESRAKQVSNNACRFENLEMFMADAIELCFNHRAKAIGNLQFGKIDRHVNFSVPPVFREESAVFQLLDCSLHKQRIPL